MAVYRPGRPSRSDPPAVPGEYRIRDATTGKLYYVGETNDLARRRREHIRSGKLDVTSRVFEWMEAIPTSTSQQRRDAERRHIDKHRPPGNKRRGGGGRPPRSDTETVTVLMEVERRRSRFMLRMKRRRAQFRD